mgnify:CR=1 FL=1
MNHPASERAPLQRKRILCLGLFLDYSGMGSVKILSIFYTPTLKGGKLILEGEHVGYCFINFLYPNPKGGKLIKRGVGGYDWLG